MYCLCLRLPKLSSIWFLMTMPSGPISQPGPFSRLVSKIKTPSRLIFYRAASFKKIACDLSCSTRKLVLVWRNLSTSSDISAPYHRTCPHFDKWHCEYLGSQSRTGHIQYRTSFSAYSIQNTLVQQRAVQIRSMCGDETCGIFLPFCGTLHRYTIIGAAITPEFLHLQSSHIVAVYVGWQ